MTSVTCEKLMIRIKKFLTHAYRTVHTEICPTHRTDPRNSRDFADSFETL